ncbi:MULTISPECIES: FAD binding domain-containing protein [Paenibacillus]|uniref:FAD binding domain-containing protein n=1 Tax=Paenibacillus TaxID=44249 RepID=UPI00038287B9|nr:MULTISPECIES: FAD binding domain-containing protein [Paenibacillus]
MNMYQHNSSLSTPLVPTVWEPSSAEEAVFLKRQYGADAAYIAGSTLLRTQWENGLLSMPEHMIRLDTIPGLRGITEHKQRIQIGALTSLRECGKNQLMRIHGNTCYTACCHIAAPSIRNQGTIGGNISSAVGDMIPALLVHDARLVWLDQANHLAPYEQELIDWLEQVRLGRRSPDAILLGIVLDKGEPDFVSMHHDQEESTFACNSFSESSSWREVSFYRKVGRREAFTPSLVTVAFRALMNREGTLVDVKMAAGGGAGLAMRLSRCEHLLEGQVYDPQQTATLAAQVEEEWASYSDPFASEAYRRQTAGNLLAAGLWEILYQEMERG